MKKVISLLLSIVMMFSVTAGIDLSAYADIVVGGDSYEGKCGENITYSFDESTGTLTLTGTGDMYDYILPTNSDSPWEGYKFSIKKIVIEDGITGIGAGAFVLCGHSYGVENDEGKYVIKGDLEITIPDSVTKIGQSAFSFSKITNLIIPNSVTSIGNWAFSCCDYIKSVYIPYSVTEIGCGPFHSCAELETITVDSTNKIYKSKDNILFGPDIESNEYSVIQCPANINMESFTIPDYVVGIGYGAFSSCKNLKNISLPNTLKVIDNYAFSASGLVELTIPGSVTYIGYSILEHCPNLKKVTVDEDNQRFYSDDYGVLYAHIKQNFDLYDEMIAYPQASNNQSYVMPTNVRYCAEIISNTLENLKINDTCESITIYCDNLKEIQVDSRNEHFSVQNGVLYEFDTEEYSATDIEKIIESTSEDYFDKYIKAFDFNVAEINCFPKKMDIDECEIPSTITKNGIEYSVIGDADVENESLKELIVPASISEIYCKCPNMEHLEIKGAYNCTINGDRIKCLKLPNTLKELCIDVGSEITAENEKAIEKEAIEKFESLSKEEQVALYNQFIANSSDLNSAEIELGLYLTNKTISDVYGTDIFYNGTKNDWANILFCTHHNNNVEYSRIHCTDGDINVVEKKTTQTTSNTGLENDIKVDYTGNVDIFDESKGEVTLNAEIVDNVTTIDNIKTVVTYDLKLYQNGEVVQPKGYVTVTIPKPAGILNPKVIYVDDNGNSTIIPTIDNGDGTLSFQTNHFSIYAVYDAPCNHDYTETITKPATCTQNGEITYSCSKCEYEYCESVEATGHKTKATTTKATTSKDGKIVKTCTVCGKTISTTVIPKASSIKLEATTLTYNGKVRTPKVIVKDSKGKTISSSNYTVSYASGRKNVGKYAVKITFKGNYTGTKTLYFTINPKSTSISSVSAGSKKFTVKWKKQSTQVTGYQIQYSTSSKFTSPKTVTVSSYKTTSKTISKLKGKKKYYVRVRTYKTVSGTKYYSNWSNAKSVTTKK